MERTQIRRVRANGVNSAFSYDLNFDPSDRSQFLNIIYGENGTGKSTFLSGIFNILTPGPRGFESLLESEIGDLVVDLTSGVTISYKFNADSPEESTLSIEGAGKKSPYSQITFESIVKRGGTFVRSAADRNFEALHSQVTIPVIFVADDRSVSKGGLGRARRNSVRIPAYASNDLRELGATGELFSRIRTHEVESAVDEAVRYLGNVTMAGVSQGSSSAESFYASFIRSVSEQQTSDAIDATTARQEIVAKINEVNDKAKAFTKYNMVALDQVKSIDAEINRGNLRRNAQQFKIIHSAVMPYLDSLIKRMESLEVALGITSAYVESINQFIDRKSFVYDAETGYKLVLEADSREIPLSSLSSGEKHLILLLSYAVSIREHGGLLIIDEPELSLGLEWRRQLVSALLECAGIHGGEVWSSAFSLPQFLMASHAVEILSRFEDCVLNPLERFPEESENL